MFIKNVNQVMNICVYLLCLCIYVYYITWYVILYIMFIYLFIYISIYIYISSLSYEIRLPNVYVGFHPDEANNAWGFLCFYGKCFYLQNNPIFLLSLLLRSGWSLGSVAVVTLSSTVIWLNATLANVSLTGMFTSILLHKHFSC